MKNIKDYLAFIYFLTKRKRVFGYLLFTRELLNVLLIIVNFFVMKSIISQLIFLELNISFSMIALIISIVCIRIAIPILNIYFNKVMVVIRLDIELDLMSKTMTMPYADLETQQMLIQLEKSKQVVSEEHFASIVASISQGIAGFIGIIVTSVILFSIHIGLLFAAVLVLALKLYVFSFYNKERKTQWEKEREIFKKERYFEHVVHKPEFVRDIRLFNVEEDVKRKGEETNDEMYELVQRHLVKGGIRVNVMIQVISYLEYVGMIIFLAYLYYEMRIDLGILIVSFGVISSLYNNMTVTMHALNNFDFYGYMVKCFLSFFFKAHQRKLEYDVIPCEFEKLEITNLQFKYPGAKENTLNNLNVVFEVGKNYAIIGKNGSGKTTFLNCLSGFYPSEGVMRVDGNQKIFKDLVHSYLFQDFHVFPATFSENIGASLEAYKRYADLLNCNHYFYDASKLLRGNTSFNGLVLSKGENQKLCLIRALTKQANIYIFDEATASMDAVSERELFTNIKSLKQKSINIFVSHRLSSIEFCDAIILMAKGEVIEQGTHLELLQKKGEYYKWYMAERHDIHKSLAKL